MIDHAYTNNLDSALSSNILTVELTDLLKHTIATLNADRNVEELQDYDKFTNIYKHLITLHNLLNLIVIDVKTNGSIPNPGHFRG